MDEQQFRTHVEAALEDLKRKLIDAEEDGDFEVEEQAGVLHISFDDPPAKFVISPNAPVQQIWISALATSFKLDWSESEGEFVLSKSGEPLVRLVSRLITEQTGNAVDL